MIASVVGDDVKGRLLAAIEEVGPDRGIFGLGTPQRERIEGMLKELEATSPYKAPTAVIDDVVAGDWRVIYTTLTILGSRRSKLALSTAEKPGLVKLGDLYQSVLPSAQHAVNTVYFRVMGGITGTFTVNASYTVASDERVAVSLIGSELRPAKLEKLLGSNVKLLTQIFNPEVR